MQTTHIQSSLENNASQVVHEGSESVDDRLLQRVKRVKRGVLNATRRSLNIALILAVSCLAISVACTPPCRFNEEENCEETGGGVIVGEGGTEIIGVIPGEELTPKSVDLLIMAPFDKSVIGQYYGGIIDAVITQLSRYEISVAHAAVAPMYRRLNSETPILYGTPDEEAEFMSYEEAMTYFSSEEGLLPLDNQVDSDGQNLLQLGSRLGTAAPYHPRQGSEGSRYLFRAPQDGMLVLWINPFERRCQLSSCDGPEGDLASALIAQNEAGEAIWLSLGGQGRLPLRRIVHAFVATEETDDEDGFFDRCANRVGLPARILDHIEPSANSLYKDLNRHLSEASISSYRVDFCQAVSDEGFDALENVALKMRQSL